MTVWRDQHIETLKQARADGLTASQIGRRLWEEHQFAVTRNSVCGMAHRLGLPKVAPAREGAGRPRLPKPAKRHGNLQHLVRPRVELPEPVRDLPPDTSPDACTLLELTERSCRYPMGDPGTEAFRFCGSEKIDGHAYCARHCRIVYRPIEHR